MVNIVHFGKYYFPDPGGIESVTISLARGAVASGHSVSVVCFKKSPADSEEVLEGVKVFRAPIDKIFASQPLGIKYFMECYKAAKDADVVHLHAPNMLAALCALFIERKTRLLVHWHSDVINKGILGKVLRPLEKALLKRADVIVAATQVYADASKELAPYRVKVKVVPYGVTESKREKFDLEFAPSFAVKLKGRKIILAVGRLVPYKGFSVLVSAAKYLPVDSVVVIVGGGPLENDLMQAIEEANVSDRVVLAGKLSDDELHALFSKATLFCLPSTYRAEAFGVVLIEAMTYGLPIVASDIPGSGVPWVNNHGVSGLNVPVQNPVALAEACNQILGSTELRAKFSEGARNRFTAEFTEDVSVKRMMAVYDDMLSS
jgi:glycosyltransferase involved in cell wall biosynthesis